MSSSRAGQAARVAGLLVLLAIAAMWASSRTSARRARTSWEGPVRIAVLVLGEATPAAMGTLQATLDSLALRLAADRATYDPAAAGETFLVELVGPLHVERRPSTVPPDPDLVSRSLHAFDLWRAARAAHAAAPGFDPGAWDVRVYVLAAAPGELAARFAEGLGEQGGEVGVVHTRFDGGSALLAASAIFHEVFHCLGAVDKYDPLGHAVLPAGLAEPDLVPRFPQRLAELMVGEVPLGPASGRLPATVGEVGVGPVTAAEVGWLPPATRVLDGR
jgi:hypothetical protein